MFVGFFWFSLVLESLVAKAGLELTVYLRMTLNLLDIVTNFYFETRSHFVTLTGLELNYVDQAGFELTEIRLFPPSNVLKVGTAESNHMACFDSSAEDLKDVKSPGLEHGTGMEGAWGRGAGEGCYAHLSSLWPWPF